MLTDRATSPPAWMQRQLRPSLSQRRIRDCSRSVHESCGL